MNTLQFAPYNESMRLGQGYNSFLQCPCVYDAIQEKSVAVQKVIGRDGTPQVVSYSSRVVSRISELTRSMNISAGASIKNGNITLTANQSAIDEAKLAASDLTAVVSVKVMNQTTKIEDNANSTLKPIEGVNIDKDNFHSIYGDSYISGFVDGGEFHGVVSIRVLDSSQKDRIVSNLKRKLNGADPKGFAVEAADQNSTFAADLKETETSIFVNWCGGGQIKQDTEQWSLDSIFRAAAAFPNKVALHPQRCWAILTRYPLSPAFHNSSLRSIPVRNYSNVQQYAADLLDDYMEFKRNLRAIDKIFDDPANYVLATSSQPIDVRAEELIVARKKMKAEMAKIVSEIEALDRDPNNHSRTRAVIASPEVWANRLPTLKTMRELKQMELSTPSGMIVDAIKLFNFANDSVSQEAADIISKIKTAPKASTATPETLVLATKEVQAMMNTDERIYVNMIENRRQFGDFFRFDVPCGTSKTMNFNDAPRIGEAHTREIWPQQLDIRMVYWGDKRVIGLYELKYQDFTISRGGLQNAVPDEGAGTNRLTISLQGSDRIVKFNMAATDAGGDERGIDFLEVEVSSGEKKWLGRTPTDQSKIIKCSVPEGFSGLKGFYGYAWTDRMIERMGMIWGK